MHNFLLPAACFVLLGVVVDYLLAILFAIVEGLTEFLPVSSTAHIRLTQFACGIDPKDKFWTMFAVVIQFGAILAVAVYFWKRLLGFVKTFPRGENKNKTWLSHPLTLVIVACIVTGVPVWLLKKTVIDENLKNPMVMGIALVVGGAIMWAVDALATRPKIKSIDQIGMLEAAWVGACQILSAVFPGTSRSMATIAGGQIFGMSRPVALEFSFFVSVPIMFAATLKELKDCLKPDDGTPALHLTANQWGVLFVGVAVSFVVAWGVIAWFMNWVKKHGFVPFAIYRLIVGAVVIALAGKLAQP
jgi:undecaprenyl-diphosphatase